MAYKKLKTFKAYGVQEDGSRHGSHRDSPDQQIYIEASGECRLFVKVPSYVAAALPKWKHYGVELSTIGEKTAAGPEHIITSREPERLQGGWNAICDAYSVWTKSQNLQRMIGIMTEKPSSFGFRGIKEHEAKVTIKFTRFVANKVPGADTAYFEWRDDKNPDLRTLSSYHASGYEQVPYTDELWAKLEQLRDQIRAADAKLQALIASGKFVDRLLSGTGQLLLGAD